MLFPCISTDEKASTKLKNREKNFEELYEFVEKTKFDKLGVFEYSKEEGTPAARLPEQIHYKTKQKRYNNA